jgi:iodotyrosine deiodinase
MVNYPFFPLVFESLPDETITGRSNDFLYKMESRRTVRDYSSRKIPRKVIKNVIRAAGTAPSGAMAYLL